MATLSLKKKPAAKTSRPGSHDDVRRAPVRGHAAARQRPTLDQAQRSRAEREAQRGAPVEITRREPGGDARRHDEPRHDGAFRRDAGTRPGDAVRRDGPPRGAGGFRSDRDGPPRADARRDPNRDPRRDSPPGRYGGFPGDRPPPPRFSDRPRDDRGDPRARDGAGYRGPRSEGAFAPHGDRPRFEGAGRQDQGPAWPGARDARPRDDRGPSRAPERGPDRGFDRGPDRGFDRNATRGAERSPGRAPERGERAASPGYAGQRPQGPGGYAPRQDDRRRTEGSAERAARRPSEGPPAGAARRPTPLARPEPTGVNTGVSTGTGERLSKRLGELGLASRRQADDWIDAGWVRVDGRVAVLGQRVGRDVVIDIDPAAHQQQAQQMTILLHKPIGYVSGQAEDGYEPAVVLVNATTRWAEDSSGVRFHPGHLRGLAPAGRLDIDSTGLLILTQDGRVARQLIGEHSTVEKEYLVRVVYEDGAPQASGPAQDENDNSAAPMHRFPAGRLARLEHGLELDGVQLKPARVSWANEDQLRFVLREGRKRQIRRMCEAVGLTVVGLKRVRIGRIPLGPLPAGQWRYLSPWERF